MQLRNGEHVIDAYRPTFDPHLDIATVVFSHVQCVKTRHSLAVVSKSWRDASKPAAAYPRRFDLDAFPHMGEHKRLTRIIAHMDNDEALSLPYDRIVGLSTIGEHFSANRNLCGLAARWGSVRLLKEAREKNRDWGEVTCQVAAMSGQLPALQYLHENGCPWDQGTCDEAAEFEHWDCLQYAVDNKCPGWKAFAELHAEHLR